MWRFWNTIKTTHNWRFPSPKSWLQRVFSESQWVFWAANAVTSDLWFSKWSLSLWALLLPEFSRLPLLRIWWPQLLGGECPTFLPASNWGWWVLDRVERFPNQGEASLRADGVLVLEECSLQTQPSTKNAECSVKCIFLLILLLSFTPFLHVQQKAPKAYHKSKDCSLLPQTHKTESLKTTGTTILKSKKDLPWEEEMKGRRPTPKKPPTQIKIVCTNSLCKFFRLFLLIFKGKGGTICTNCPEIVVRKLFVQTVFIWVGGFFGWVFPSWRNRGKSQKARTHTMLFESIPISERP